MATHRVLLRLNRRRRATAIELGPLAGARGLLMTKWMNMPLVRAPLFELLAGQRRQ